MLASILNLPRRIKSASSPTTPTPGSSCAALGDPCNGPEEDGFVLVGESAIERSTVMPVNMQNGGVVTIAPPPSYEQVTTGSMPGLPPIGADPHRGPTTSSLFLDSHQQNTMQQRTSDVVAAANLPTDNTTSTDGILNKSSNTNWAIEDVPFELSALLAQSRRPMSEYYVPEVQAVDWRQYDYDFQYEANVKRDSELALERMEEEEMEDEEEEENSSQEDLMSFGQ